MGFGEGDFYGFKFTFDQKAATELVHTALDQGINFFDTADGYGNGQSETMLGKALGDKRKEVLLATKISFFPGSQAFRVGVNAKHLIEQCQTSLQKLGTDYVDVLLLHLDDPITPIDETLKAMENLVQRGLVRYIGLSNYSAWKASAMVQRQKDLHYSPFVAAQMHYSLLNREVERECIPMCLHHGVGMMVWSPLSGGFLTGKYTRQQPQPEAARLNSFDMGLFDREVGYTVVERLTEIASNKNTTPTAVAIAWLLAKQVVSTVVVGVSKAAQLDASIAGSHIQLSPEELASLDAVTLPVPHYPTTFQSMQSQTLLQSKRF